MLVCLHTYQNIKIGGEDLEKRNKTEFGELLTRLIKQKKMTQSYFYSQVGITKPYFYDIMAEKTSPSPEVQYKMLEILRPSQADQEKFFDLIAKTKDDLPADIYKYLKGNKEMYKMIRKIMEEEK